MEEKEKFFAKGKYFDSFEELLEYERKWPEMQLDLQDFKNFLDQRYREAEMNLKFRGTFTNKEAYLLLRGTTDWIDPDCDFKPMNKDQFEKFLLDLAHVNKELLGKKD